jgi:hypothetical protein
LVDIEYSARNKGRIIRTEQHHLEAQRKFKQENQSKYEQLLKCRREQKVYWDVASGLLRVLAREVCDMQPKACELNS